METPARGCLNCRLPPVQGDVQTAHWILRIQVIVGAQVGRGAVYLSSKIELRLCERHNCDGSKYANKDRKQHWPNAFFDGPLIPEPWALPTYTAGDNYATLTI